MLMLKITVEVTEAERQAFVEKSGTPENEVEENILEEFKNAPSGSVMLYAGELLEAGIMARSVGLCDLAIRIRRASEPKPETNSETDLLKQKLEEIRLFADSQMGEWSSVQPPYLPADMEVLFDIREMADIDIVTR